MRSPARPVRLHDADVSIQGSGFYGLVTVRLAGYKTNRDGTSSPIDVYVDNVSLGHLSCVHAEVHAHLEKIKVMIDEEVLNV